MRVVAYLRVSTDRQAEEGLGLDVQRQGIRAWAKAHGHRIVAWHADEGGSGSNGLDGRAALAEVFAQLKDGGAVGLVVYRLDRLARDLVLQEQLLAEVWRIGGQVFSTSVGEESFLVDDLDDPSRRLIRQVLGAVNEYERSMIRLRLRSGRKRKAELGGYAYGAPPFGSRAFNGQLVADGDEQRVVERMRTLRASGKSLRAIANALAKEGYTPRRGNAWHPKVIASILSRAAS